MHRDATFWYTGIAWKRWAYILEPNWKEQLSLRVSLPVPTITLDILVVSTSLLAWFSSTHIGYRLIVEGEFPHTPCPSVGQFSPDVTSNCSAFSEELKSSPKDCSCSERLSSFKKTNQPHLDTSISLLGPVLNYLGVCCKCGRNHLQYENYQKVNGHWKQNTGAETPAWISLKAEGFSAYLT